MRKRYLALWLLTALPCFGEGLFLWEAEGENGKAYLLGSIHLAKPELYPLPQPIEDAFSESDSLVVEINLNEGDEAAMAAKMLTAGVYGDGRKLTEELSDETSALFRGYLEERGLPLPMFDALRPWMAALTVSISEMQRLGFDPELGIDKHFLDQAKSNGKPVLQLETADYQIELLSGFDEELQEKFLLYTLRDVERTGEMIDTIMAAWSDGDTSRMEELLLESGLDDPGGQAIYQKMYLDRNHAMADKIRGMLEAGGTYFVVVGAGHLIGEEGIVELLGADYAVRQFEAAAAAAR